MSAARSNYIPLLALAADWAAEGGMPKELVLRRLCEWAMAGGFPDGAFITATGAEVAPFDIYMSFHAVAEDNNGLLGRGICLDGSTFYNTNQQWGMHVLGKALVTAPNVFAFCEHTKTLAPPSLLSGFSRFLARWDQTRHLAPPKCPDAHEHAARHDARGHAVVWLNTLRRMLSGLQGNTTRSGPPRAPGEPIDLEYWSAEWRKTYDEAQNAIARSQNPGLQQELDSLDAEWNAFVDQEPVAVRDDIGQSQGNSIVASADISERPKRRGRPSGSGSYEALDAPIVEQMREIILKEPNVSPTAAANRFAEDAPGGGGPESKAKRLAGRYSAKYGDPSR